MLSVIRSLVLAALLLPQEGVEGELAKIEEAWARRRLEELLPLVDAVIRQLPADRGSLDPHRCRRLTDVLLRAGRVASLERLEEILAAKGDPRSQARALEVRGERIGATGDLAAIRAHLEAERPAGETRAYFLERVREAGKLRELIDGLMETSAEHPDFRFHAELLRGLPWYWMSNSERNEMHMRLREKEIGPDAIPAADRLRIAIQLADEQKFEAAHARIRTILDGPSRLTGDERSAAEQVLARCLIEAVDTKGAVAACGRARMASKVQALSVWLLEARARLGGGDAGGAVRGWRHAFEAARGAGDAEGKFRQSLWVAWEIREALRRWPDQRGPVVGACGDGDLFVLAVAREAAGDAPGAAAALDVLHRAQPGDPAMGFERVRLHLAAGKPAKAVQARVGLSAFEASVVDRRTTRRLEGLEELDRAIVAAGEECGAWEALKEFGLHLAGQPGWHIQLLVEILDVVREPDYLDAVERAGLAAAADEGQRWWAVEPVILACHRLGRDAETQRRLANVTLDRGFSPSAMELAWSWRNDFARPEVRSRDPLEELRRRSLQDDPLSYRDAARGHEEKALDRCWRAAVRAGGDATALRIGASRGRPAERIACLERILADPASGPAWAGSLAELLLEAGATERLKALIRSARHRPAAAELLESKEGRLPRDLAEALAREFDVVEACGYAWTLRGKAPDPLEDRLAPLLRWRSRAASEAERRRAGEELDKVAAVCAPIFLKTFVACENEKELAALLRVGVPLLRSESELGDSVRRRVREVIEASGAEFWKLLRSTPWPAPAPEDAAAIRREVRRLGDEDLDVRTDAQRTLRAAGMTALPLLLEQADQEDVEIRGRVRDLILQAFLAPAAGSTRRE